KVAKEAAEARGKWLLADVEEKLAARYQFGDKVWADVTDDANRAVKEADAKVAAICRARGIPEEFRPGLQLSWYDRGENAMKARPEELRRAAQAKIAALVKDAHVEIDQQMAEQLTELTKTGLTSEEARAFITAMPAPEELLLPIDSLQLHDGEL